MLRKHTRRAVKAAFAIALGVALLLGVSAHGARSAGPTVSLGTKDFSEEFLLGQLYKQGLQAKGYSVSYHENVGSTEIIDAALTSESQISNFKSQLPRSGLDTLEFQFAPNPGEPPRPDPRSVLATRRYLVGTGTARSLLLNRPLHYLAALVAAWQSPAPLEPEPLDPLDECAWVTVVAETVGSPSGTSHEPVSPSSAIGPGISSEAGGSSRPSTFMRRFSVR